MKKIFMFLTVAAAVAMTVSCKPDPILEFKTASDSKSDFEAAGGSKTVAFTANYDWTAESSETWLTVSPASGTADAGSITLKAAENTGSAARTASVTVKMEDITIQVSCTQAAYKVALTNAEDATKTFLFSGSESTVSFEANGTWMAASSADWLTVTPTTGVSGTGSIALKAAVNNGENRTATVTVTCGSAKTEISCVQEEAIFSFTDGDNGNYYWANQKGGTVTVNVSANMEYSYNIAPGDDGTVPDWITVTKAAVASKIDLNVAFNDWGYYREAKLAVEHNGAVDTLTIGQGSSVWSEKLSNYVTLDNVARMTTAVVGDNFIICPGDGTAPIIVNWKTAEKTGTLNVGDIKVGAVANDDAGNLVICTNVQYDATTGGWADDLYIYRMKGVSGTPEQIVDLYPDMPLGGQISVRGDLFGDAVIGAATEAIPDVSLTATTYYWVLNGGKIKGGDQKLDLTGFVGLGWQPGYWNIFPENRPAFSPIGSAIEKGFAFSVYDENVVYFVNPSTGACTPIIQPQSDGASWGYGYSSVKFHEVGGETYVALYGMSFFNYFNDEFFVGPLSKMFDLANVGKTIDALATSYFQVNSQLDEAENTAGGYGAGGDVSLASDSDYLYVIGVGRVVNAIDCYAVPLK